MCFFSKHLPRMDASHLGRALKALGFDGVDLTVRPGGHIDPMRVVEDLPPFVTALRNEGLTVMIALKDFFWEKTAAGWRQRNCPMGEGMIDWKAFFAMLAKSRFHGPASLHLEYPVPGATPDALEANTLAAAARDLAFVKARLDEAYN